MKYDLHMHTFYSKCSNLKPNIILNIAKKIGLDGIAITDHNTIKGALVVSKLNKDKNFEIIIGSEIKTDYGDLLAYYLQNDIKSRNLFEVLDEIKKQGAVSSIAHPFRLPHLRFRYPIDKLKNKIDAIECFNSRNFFWSNKVAFNTAERLNIAKTAGSDAHFKFEIGKAYTIFDGSLRKAIKKNKTKLEGTTLYGPFGGLLSFFRNRLY